MAVKGPVNNLTQKDRSKLKAVYTAAAKDVKKRLESLGKDTLDRLTATQLQNYLKTLSRDIFVKEKNVVEDIIKEKTGNVASGMEDVLQAMGISEDAIEARLYSVNQNVIENLINGRLYKDNKDWSLSKSLWSDTVKVQNDCYNAVAQGIAANKGVKEIAKDLQSIVNPNESGNTIDKVYSRKTSYNAERLARTLSQHAYQADVVEMCRDNPLVIGIRWIANGPDPCPLCKERNGKVYPVDGVPWEHPNGFCVLEPVYKENWEDEVRQWRDGAVGENPELDAVAEDFGANLDPENPLSVNTQLEGKSEKELLTNFFSWDDENFGETDADALERYIQENGTPLEASPESKTPYYFLANYNDATFISEWEKLVGDLVDFDTQRIDIKELDPTTKRILTNDETVKGFIIDNIDGRTPNVWVDDEGRIVLNNSVIFRVERVDRRGYVHLSASYYGKYKAEIRNTVDDVYKYDWKFTEEVKDTWALHPDVVKYVENQINENDYGLVYKQIMDSGNLTYINRGTYCYYSADSKSVNIMRNGFGSDKQSMTVILHELGHAIDNMGYSGREQWSVMEGYSELQKDIQMWQDEINKSPEFLNTIYRGAMLSKFPVNLMDSMAGVLANRVKSRWGDPTPSISRLFNLTTGHQKKYWTDDYTSLPAELYAELSEDYMSGADFSLWHKYFPNFTKKFLEHIEQLTH